MERAGGAPNGFDMPWQNRAFEWTLPSHEGDLTGNLSINRTGAGLTYAGFESHAQTLLAYGAITKKYEQLPTQNGLGELGLSAMHFVSEGENSSRGVIDDSPSLATSVTTYQYSFSAGQSAPSGTVISLFDPGLAESNGPTTSRGPLTYRFTASLEGHEISTERWSLQVADPYSPVGNSQTTHLWDGERGLLHVNNYTNSLGADFPDNIALVQTGFERFDTLTIEVESLASELVAIGITGPILPVPEPSHFAFLIVSALFLLNRRRNH